MKNKSINNPELHRLIYNKEEMKYETKIKDFNHMPNQKWHKIISFIKSGVRILGYVAIPFSLTTACVVLILSEVIGIVEEMV
jgi:hypothetical protein